MTINDTIKILSIIKATYPQSFKKMTREDGEALINVWTSEFNKVETKYIILAFDRYKADRSRQFAPNINDIHRILDDIKNEAEKLLFYDKTFGNAKIPEMCKNCEGLKFGELQFLKPCAEIICPKDNQNFIELNERRSKYSLTEESRSELQNIVNGINIQEDNKSELDSIIAAVNSVKRLK